MWAVKKFDLKFDVSEIRAELNKLTEDDWCGNIYDYVGDKEITREDLYYVHKSTNSIALKMNATNISKGNYIPDDPAITHIFEDNYSFWNPYIEPITTKVLESFPGKDKFINKCILVRLRPNSEIAQHYDSGLSLIKSHRLHVPIITNDDVFFTVGSETVNMKEGVVYEINNDKQLHSVVNNSDYDRIHLIFDIYCPSEQ
jgi:hypothetical protein